MRTVIIRDDDTNALTPISCLETLYRPFLDRGLPVNLATVPEVRTTARTPDGAREGFLPRTPNPAVETVALAENRALVEYLQANPGFAIVQHGCYHDTFEFDLADRAEVVRRIERGTQRLREAGYTDVRAFVAPHDKISPIAYEELAKRFRVISTGWFEWRRLPQSWRPRYVWRKLTKRPHWRIDDTLLMSHPGCLLSYLRPMDTMLDTIKAAIDRQEVTVLVTHWWEYFRDGKTDERFVAVLHQVAEYLASRADVHVTTFDALGGKPEPQWERATPVGRSVGEAVSVAR